MVVGRYGGPAVRFSVEIEPETPWWHVASGSLDKDIVRFSAIFVAFQHIGGKYKLKFSEGYIDRYATLNSRSMAPSRRQICIIIILHGGLKID